MPLTKPDPPVWQPGSAPAGVKLYLPLTEGTGTAVADASPEGNDGAFTGAGNWDTSAYGPVVTTNASDLLDVPRAAFGTGYPVWTQMLCANPTATLGVMFALSGGGGLWQSIINLFADVSLYMDDGAGGVVRVDVTSSAVNDGNYHVYSFVSRSASQHEVWIDGVQAGTSTTSTSLAAGLTTFSVGGRAGALGYSGYTAAFASGYGAVPDFATFGPDWLSGEFSAIRVPFSVAGTSYHYRRRRSA